MSAVALGMLKSRGRYKIFLDCDLPYPLNTIERMLTILKTERIDVCVGDRYIEGSSIITDPKTTRKIMSILSQRLIPIIIPIQSQDTQCGVKGFTKEAADFIFSRITIKRFAFDVEVFYLAGLGNFKIRKIPVTLVADCKEISNVSLFLDGIVAFLDLLKIRMNRIRGVY